MLGNVVGITYVNEQSNDSVTVKGAEVAVIYG